MLQLNLQGGGVAEFRHFMPSRALRAEGIDVVDFSADDAPRDQPAIEKYFLDNAKSWDLIHTGYPSSVVSINTLVAVRNYANIPLIIDVDDDFMNVPTYNYAYKDYMSTGEQRRVALLAVRAADAVTVTTPALRDVLAKYARHTEVLPNYNDATCWDYPARPGHAADQHIYIMFPNSLGHYGDLNEIRDVVRELMGKYANLRLIFMGCVPDWAMEWAADRSDAKANRTFIIQPSSVRTYRQILRWLAPHIIAAPLQDNAFNSSKSCIKAYDAAMCGAAFICTDIATYADVPADACIKVSNTHAQWRESLEALIEDADLRQRLTDRLRIWTLTQRDIRGNISQWKRLYEDVVARPVCSKREDIVRA